MKNYNREIVINDDKSIIIYFMLEAKQRVNHQVSKQLLGTTQRTFQRIIATLRRSLENANIFGIQIIYDKTSHNYKLIKTS